MLDTPGVIPISERGDMKHLIIASQDPHKAEHPEDAAEYLLENNKNKLEKWYGIKPTDADTGLELLEKITLKLNCKKKGNLPDLRRGAIMVLRNWQKGKQ
jgi:ribosome biogenesis GTPase A